LTPLTPYIFLGQEDSLDSEPEQLTLASQIGCVEGANPNLQIYKFNLVHYKIGRVA